MLTFCTLVLTISLSLFLLTMTVETVIKLKPSLFPSLGLSDEQSEEVEDAEGIFLRPKFNIEEFKRRMEALRDEDGLYDIVDFKPPKEFTGTEIVNED